MSSWSCPHDDNGVCMRVSGAVCDPGMRGCVLHGKYIFANQDPNAPRKPVPARRKEEPAAEPAVPRRRLPF
ncbi:MAG: hypothetical protein C0522_11865 [Rhodocyclaceae bacterium]|jgi:hypothetical protein|nr:hypothetical protein [Rhodocyclaceae bacterium]